MKVRLLIFLFSCLSMAGCDSDRQSSYFEDWFTQNEESLASRNSDCSPILHEELIESKPLQIRGLVPSMTGDLSHQAIKIADAEDLIWLKGCSLDIVEANTKKEVGEEYLCHNIVNYSAANGQPWKIQTKGTDKRIFTLSQGLNEFEFPEGFALPMSTPAHLSVGNQVLNLNDPDLEASLEFQVKLSYWKNEELCERPKALYQQPIFVTKKVAGPAGAFYKSEADTQLSHLQDTGFVTCGISYEEGYNPYMDPYGREFTGHWQVSTDSVEVLRTNVTPMMDLQYDTRIHAIAVHLHPYAHSLELIDRTANLSLFTSIAEKNENQSIRSVSTYSSEEGIPVYKDHEYQLVSTYVNPDGREGITAMATMFLYLLEKPTGEKLPE